MYLSLGEAGTLEQDTRRMTHGGDSIGRDILVLRVDTTEVGTFPHSRALGLLGVGISLRRASDTTVLDRRTTYRCEHERLRFPA